MNEDKLARSKNFRKNKTASRVSILSNLDITCRKGCEYCTVDAYEVKDLYNGTASYKSCSIDPREAELNGNEAELFVAKIVEDSFRSDPSSQIFKGMS